MARAEDATGLAGFVGKRNTSFDDLKVSTKPIKASANTHVTRAADGSTMRAKSNSHNPQAAHQNVPRTLQDTDTSLGNTTTTPGSTNRAHSAGDAHGLVHETVPSHAPPDEQFNTDDSDIESYSDNDPSDDERELSEQHAQVGKARQATTAQGGAPHTSQSKPDGRNLGRISGDTYPETTSGRPSTTHVDDNRGRQTAAYSQNNSAQPIMMPERGAGTRLTYMPQSGKPHSNGLNRQQAIAQPQQPIAPPLRPEDVLRQVQSSFVYSLASSNKQQAAHTQSAPPPKSHHFSTKPAAASTAHRGQSISGNEVQIKEVRNEQPVKHTRPEPQYTAPVLLQKPRLEGGRHYTVPEPQISRPAPQPPQHHFRHHSDNAPPAQKIDAPASEMMAEVGDVNNHDYLPQGSSTEAQFAQLETDEPVTLDYDPPGLYAKTFNDLKAASFDADPNAAEPSVLCALQPDDPLAKKLQNLLSLDIRAKQEYFALLGIEEWEEAGDWFLESFAKLTDRFKIARQEKRKIAREFEHEVELRHNSIFKKQKLTAGAMNEMKESGGKVLQGTPKKGARQGN